MTTCFSSASSTVAPPRRKSHWQRLLLGGETEELKFAFGSTRVDHEPLEQSFDLP